MKKAVQATPTVRARGTARSSLLETLIKSPDHPISPRRVADLNGDTRSPDPAGSAGFSLLEMLISVAIITILMSGVFAFMFQTQKRFQSNVVVSESNQTARAAMEIMTQEIGQAGRNPNFQANRYAASATGTWPAAVSASGQSQCITIADDTAGTKPDITRIEPGDWLSFDTGPYYEISMVGGNSNTPNPTGVNCATAPIPRSCPCTGANQVRVVLQLPHATVPFPVMSYKFPYATGILTGTGPNGTVTTSTDHMLEFFGDINDDGVINYVVYSLSPTTTPATTVTINGAAYILYNLYRSITPANYPVAAFTGYQNNPASAIVQNVLYQDITASYTAPATPVGPTGQPIFGYPQILDVGALNNIAVVGTLVVTISVAVNPQALEAGVVQWYTMSTQIRPLNTVAAVAVNLSGGSTYMNWGPLDLPLANPTNYYQ